MCDKYEPNASALTKTILLDRPTSIYILYTDAERRSLFLSFLFYILYALGFVTRNLSTLAGQLT